ncbi:hypothetical protein PSR62_09390 [Rhodopirellula sp. P2]|nr:hypothetical protein [Rhodopirellula sp. P2]WDQ18743.1 hypothetical protein PSR62_09390 [Rhodopirellula sp. P2]
MAAFELVGEVAGRLALFQSIGWVPGNNLAYLGAEALSAICNLKLSIELFQFPRPSQRLCRPGSAWRGDWLAAFELVGEVAGRLALFQSIGWVPGNNLAYFGAEALSAICNL